MFDRAARGVGLGRAFEHGRSAASRRRTLRKSFHFAFDRRSVASGAVALAARFHDFFGVVAGTTLGMMIANVPAILPGDRFARRLPTQPVHGIAAVMFVVLGTLALFGVGV
jgi:putative Ca2+/H+ antiporter (TMEM165/GDT1 family)